MEISNSAQIRELDRQMIEEQDYASILLMENAGRSAAQRILRLYPDVPGFLLLCGVGNNGGDGMVIARYLHQAKRKVWVVLAQAPEQLKNDALTNYRIIHKAGVRIDLFGEDIKPGIQGYLREGCILIDALLGTGMEAQFREPMAQLINWFRGFPNDCVAVDLPSGLSCNTGQLINTPLRCSHTLTFQLPKVCHYVTPAANYCGKVDVLDIGIYRSLIEQNEFKIRLITDEDIRRWHRPRQPDTHKMQLGHVLLAGGSQGKAGAIALSTQSAMEVGAGLCTAFIPGSAACAYHRTTLENMSIPYGTERTAFLNSTAGEVFCTYLEKKNVVLVGPGLGHTPDTSSFVATALANIEQPMVLDADALNILAEQPRLWDFLGKNSQVVLTPHPGEMARLMGLSTDEVQQRRLEVALELATSRKVIVVLKGQFTLVALPSGRVYINPAGNPGMSTAGTGDVLAGAIAGFIAQGYPIGQAAVMGVYIHSLAGDLVASVHGMEGVTASKIMRSLGFKLREVLTNSLV